MELRQIRYFLSVARTGHFRAAAKALDVAQPAVSQQISLLETELGVKLFDRNNRYVRLTPAGEIFLTRADRIIGDVEGANEEIAEFRGMMRGRLRIGILYSLGLEAFQLPHLLAEFYNRYPAIQAVIREQNGPQLFEWLLLGEIDLAFVLMSSPGIPPPGITVEPLFTEELVVIMAPGHCLAGREQLSLSELQGQRFIVFRAASASRESLASHAAASGFAPDIAFEVSDNAMLRALAAQGLGVALVPRWCSRPQEPAIAVVKLDPPGLSLTLALAWAERLYSPPAASAFRDLVYERLKRQ